MPSEKVLLICKQKLINIKADLLNRVRSHFLDFKERETGGDEVDQAVSILTENQLFISHQRLRSQLLEIESALTRIEKGVYGICEETEEVIDPGRLIAIPWTRLSLEGAEMRESRSTKSLLRT